MTLSGYPIFVCRQNGWSHIKTCSFFQGVSIQFSFQTKTCHFQIYVEVISAISPNYSFFLILEHWYLHALKIVSRIVF